MHGNSKSKESGGAFWNNNSFQGFFFFSQKYLEDISGNEKPLQEIDV